MIGLTQEGDDALITLDEPLGYNHSATYEDYTASDGTTKRVEFRAVVVLLSRNIVFRGS